MRQPRTWWDITKIVAALVAMILILRADMCGDDPPRSDPAGTVRITVTLANLDTENIHILEIGEPFKEGPPPAGNRLGPGLTRTVDVGPFRVGDEITFSAGRLQDVFDTESCSVTNASFTSKRARVEWLGVALQCSGW